MNLGRGGEGRGGEGVGGLTYVLVIRVSIVTGDDTVTYVERIYC